MLTLKHAGNAEQIAKMLIDAGCSVNLTGYEKQSALHLAVARGMHPSILIKAGVNVNSADHEGNTALHIAAQVTRLYNYTSTGLTFHRSV